MYFRNERIFRILMRGLNLLFNMKRVVLRNNLVWAVKGIAKTALTSSRSKHGGLDSRDQSRSRSRMSSVSRTIFFFSVEIFKIEIFQSRFILVEIFIEIIETNRDSRFSRFVETFQDLSRYLDIIQTFWGTSGSKMLTN